MPGDTGRIQLSFYPRAGNIHKYAFLHTNIPEAAPADGYVKYKFTLVGNVPEQAVMKETVPVYVPVVEGDVSPVLFPVKE